MSNLVAEGLEFLKRHDSAHTAKVNELTGKLHKLERDLEEANRLVNKTTTSSSEASSEAGILRVRLQDSEELKRRAMEKNDDLRAKLAAAERDLHTANKKASRAEEEEARLSSRLNRFELSARQALDALVLHHDSTTAITKLKFALREDDGEESR